MLGVTTLKSKNFYSFLMLPYISYYSLTSIPLNFMTHFTKVELHTCHNKTSNNIYTPQNVKYHRYPSRTIKILYMPIAASFQSACIEVIIIPKLHYISLCYAEITEYLKKFHAKVTLTLIKLAKPGSK